MMKTKIWNFSSDVRSMAEKNGLVVVGLKNGKIEEISSRDQLQSPIVVHDWNRPVSAKKRNKRVWEGHEFPVTSLLFTSDGKLVSMSLAGDVKKWDLERGVNDESLLKKVLKVWESQQDMDYYQMITELVDGRLIVAGMEHDWSNQGALKDYVRVLDGVTGFSSSWVGEKNSGQKIYTGISLGDHNADLLAFGYDNGNIMVWTNDGLLVRIVETGEVILSLSLSPIISSFGNQPAQQLVAAGFDDGSVKLFRLPNWDIVTFDGKDVLMKVHTGGVNSVSWSPDGRFFACVDYVTITIFSASNGVTLRTLNADTSVVSTLFSQDGTKILSRSRDKAVRVWRLCEQDDRIASLLSDRLPSDLIYQGEDVFYQLFKKIRQKLIG